MEKGQVQRYHTNGTQDRDMEVRTELLFSMVQDNGLSMSLLQMPPPDILSCYIDDDKQFCKRKLQNEFRCLCDGLWFKNNIKCHPKAFASVTDMFCVGIDFSKYMACCNCMHTLNFMKYLAAGVPTNNHVFFLKKQRSSIIVFNLLCKKIFITNE